jgi:VIT1/CCC1 family predicted Fe2+/Mn2+ transporter
VRSSCGSAGRTETREAARRRRVPFAPLMYNVPTMKQRNSSTAASYIRNFVFGVEDSLVSTVGLLSGIAMADVPRATIFLTGVVLVFVEAISMAAGSFLSEKSAEDFERRRETSAGRAIADGAVMFFSYFIAGFIPLGPYAFFETTQAFWISIILSIGALFALGAANAKLSHVSIWRSALRMMIVGGLAIGVGILIGRITGSL